MSDMDTLLIPSVIALSKFFYESFPNISWYPNWYLGNPFNFLIGPVIPVILSIFKLSSLDFYPAYLSLIFSSFPIGAIFLYLFLRNFNLEKKQALISSTLYLLIPGSLYLLKYQNGLFYIAFSFIPLIFFLYKRFLKKDSIKNSLYLVLGLSFLLLIDVSVVLPIAIGFISLFFALKIKDEVKEKIFKTVLLFLLAISISSFWYTFRFWWVLLSNPSLGGFPLVNLISNFFKLLIQILPALLAITFVKFRQKNLKEYQVFSIIFLSSFAFLTIARFLLDPDFVMDWVGFVPELQLGIAILAGSFLFKKIKLTIVAISIFATATIVFFSSLFSVTRLAEALAKRVSFQNNANQLSVYQKKIEEMVKNNVGKNERVFLSGSSVFWINSVLDVQQVRGVNDPASIHPFWAHGAFYVREGKDPELVEAWLKILGASKVLVHTQGSKEPFRDFKKPDNFKQLLRVEENSRDVLYKLDSSIGRIADSDIIKTNRPKKGDDKRAIYSYANKITKPVEVDFLNPDRISVQSELGEDEIISLAISYDKRWNLVKGEGRVVSDVIGNTVIVPTSTLRRGAPQGKPFDNAQGKQNFEMKYSFTLFDRLLPLFSSIVLVFLIARFDFFFELAKRKMPEIHLGLGEEDE